MIGGKDPPCVFNLQENQYMTSLHLLTICNRMSMLAGKGLPNPSLTYPYGLRRITARPGTKRTNFQSSVTKSYLANFFVLAVSIGPP